MTTAVPSAALATIQPVLTDAERVALAGFLALFTVRRADIESFARELETRGRARATVTRRLSTIAGFYRYAVEEELLASSPAAHVRRPRVDYESHTVALDRNELGALLVAARLGTAGEHALISLLAPPTSPVPPGNPVSAGNAAAWPRHEAAAHGPSQLRTASST